MWSDRCTAPLNLVYLGYALGALLSLTIVQFFRSVSDPAQLQLELIGPYTTASILCLICSIGFTLIAVKQRKRINQHEAHRQESVTKLESFDQVTFWQRSSPTTCGQGYFLYGFVLLFLLMMFNFCFGKLCCADNQLRNRGKRIIVLFLSIY
jgi:hypothetical protein